MKRGLLIWRKDTERYPKHSQKHGGNIFGIIPVEKPIVISYEPSPVQINEIDEYEIEIRTTITKEQLLNVLEELY